MNIKELILLEKNNEIILNNKFKEWKDEIIKNIQVRNSNGDNSYECEPYKKLFEVCKDHANSFKKYKRGNKTILLTHPFYLFLSHSKYLETTLLKKDSQDYLNRLSHLLDINKENTKTNIVVLETLHHYPSITSNLLEKGLIDRVIFTKYDSGIPVNMNELKDFYDDTIFFAGTYDTRCLTQSIQCMNKYAFKDYIWGLKDLVLTSPKDSSSLKTEEIKEINFMNQLNLEEITHWLFSKED